MRNRVLRIVVTLVAATAVIVTGASASARTDAPDTHKAAVGIVRMDGAQETPAAGDADGRGVFAYAAFGDHLCYVITAKDIDPAVVSHIHSGARGVAGPIVVMLEPPTDGLSFACIDAVDNATPNTIDVLLQSDFDAIVANPAGFYANVHNAPFPAGALRGQLR